MSRNSTVPLVPCLENGTVGHQPKIDIKALAISVLHGKKVSQWGGTEQVGRGTVGQAVPATPETPTERFTRVCREYWAGCFSCPDCDMRKLNFCNRHGGTDGGWTQ